MPGCSKTCCQNSPLLMLEPCTSLAPSPQSFLIAHQHICCIYALFCCYLSIPFQKHDHRHNCSKDEHKLYMLWSELMELKQNIVNREAMRLNKNKGCFSINRNGKLPHCASLVKYLLLNKWFLLLAYKFPCSLWATPVVCHLESFSCTPL